jgi:hypothetical protein
VEAIEKEKERERRAEQQAIQEVGLLWRSTMMLYSSTIKPLLCNTKTVTLQQAIQEVTLKALLFNTQTVGVEIQISIHLSYAVL